jgi:polar amino acid transport system permease protein
MQAFAPYLPLLLKGIPVTLGVTFLALAVAVPTAFLLALGKSSRWGAARLAAGFVTEVFRGTSALVQLFWAFYVLPFFGINLSPLVAAVLVFGLNEGSYFSEVVRAGLASVRAGQLEAAVTLHLPQRYRFFRIILPQALPVMIPPFGNSVIGMLKFTSLVSLVTIQDLAYRAGAIRSTVGASGPVYGATLLVYFGLAILLGRAVKVLEYVVNRHAGRTVRTDATRRRSPVPAWALGR